MLVYTFTAGFLGGVPEKPILNETIRNLYFHVAMWMVLMIFLIISLVYSLKYLRHNNPADDICAVEFARAGVVFGLLGLLTGSVWAKYTWGDFWSNDPKQIGAAIALLIYLAYFVLRNSLTDPDKSARISAVYNVFAFAMLFPTLWIIPRLVESLHPGWYGESGFQYERYRQPHAGDFLFWRYSRLGPVGWLDLQPAHSHSAFFPKSRKQCINNFCVYSSVLPESLRFVLCRLRTA